MVLEKMYEKALFQVFISEDIFYALYDSSNHKSRTILIYKGFYLEVRKQTYLNLEHVLS